MTIDAASPSYWPYVAGAGRIAAGNVTKDAMVAWAGLEILVGIPQQRRQHHQKADASLAHPFVKKSKETSQHL